MSKDTTKKFAIGALIAAVAGFIAGLLTAPKSGKETRSDIKQAANKGIDEAEKQVQNLHNELNELNGTAKAKGSELSGKAKKELDDLVAKAKDSKEKAGTVLTAIRKGAAEDKDLDKAVAEAAKALSHLRKYLTK